MDPVDAHIGARIRARRLALSLTQTQVAKPVGVRFQQIQKYENGSNRIAASQLHKIARRLRVPIAYFYEGLVVDGAGQPNEIDQISTAVLVDQEIRELVRNYLALSPHIRRAISSVTKEIRRETT